MVRHFLYLWPGGGRRSMVFGPFSQGKLFLSMAIAGKKEQAQFAEEAVMRHWGRVVGLTLSLLFFAVRVAPQGGASGAISGIVQDPSGGVIGSAQVEIVSEATGQVVRDLITDSSGSFTATLLPVGSYSVEVSAAGFARTKFTGVLVRVTETTQMTAALKVTQATETVTGSAEIATINTANAATGEALRATTVSPL